MPIRRGAHGKIVEQPTEPVGHRREAADVSSAEAPTEPIKPDPSDSLFAAEAPPAPAGSSENDQMEAATVVIGGGDSPTRVVRPRRRRQSLQTRPVTARNDPMADPPVGWLVVVRGPGKGRVLTLGNGMNSIGRGQASRVRVDFCDDTISSANHARLVYEPRRRRYLLSDGDGRNLTYLDGELVQGATPVESGAMIEVGETTLRFQAFCTEEFDWPDLDD